MKLLVPARLLALQGMGIAPNGASHKERLGKKCDMPARGTSSRCPLAAAAPTLIALPPNTFVDLGNLSCTARPGPYRHVSDVPACRPDVRYPG